MGASSTTLHEDAACLGEQTVERHRAIVSLMEELEAIDAHDADIVQLYLFESFTFRVLTPEAAVLLRYDKKK